MVAQISASQGNRPVEVYIVSTETDAVAVSGAALPDNASIIAVGFEPSEQPDGLTGPMCNGCYRYTFEPSEQPDGLTGPCPW